MFLFRNCWITELYVGWDGSVWSGDIAEVLVKAECRIHSDTEVFEMLEYVIGWLSMMIGGGMADVGPTLLVSCGMVKGNILFLF